MNRSGNRMATDQSDRVLGLPRWTANGRGTVERILSAPAALATGLPRREEEHRHQVGLADPSPDAPDEGALARLGSMVLEAHGRIAEANQAHERVVAGIMAETSEEVARLLRARAPLPPDAVRSGLRRFLYVDTVLPMLAVLIMLVILLAWVG